MHLLLIAKIITIVLASLLSAGFLTATLRALLSGPHSPFSLSTAMHKAATEGWLHRSLVAFDIAVNVILLRGQQDETISTHSWRASLDGKLWGRLMCAWLNLFQPNHGEQAAAGDLERARARVAVLSALLGAPNV